MKSDMHIRRVPLVRADLKCPVCGKPLARYKLQSVDLYSKDYWKTRVVQRWLLYCDVCRLPFASQQTCEKINSENGGFHVEGFPVTQRDGIQSIRSGMQEHAYAWKKNRERERQREQERKKQQELQAQQAQMEAQKEAQLEKECQERMRAIPSASVMICVQFGSGDAQEFIIVNLQRDENVAKNILHYKNPDALELLTAAFAWQRIWCGKLHGKPYKVTKKVYASSENRFFVNPSDIDVLKFGDKKTSIQKPTIRYTALMCYCIPPITTFSNLRGLSTVIGITAFIWTCSYTNALQKTLVTLV